MTFYGTTGSQRPYTSRSPGLGYFRSSTLCTTPYGRMRVARGCATMLSRAADMVVGAHHTLPSMRVLLAHLSFVGVTECHVNVYLLADGNPEVLHGVLQWVHPNTLLTSAQLYLLGGGFNPDCH